MTTRFVAIVFRWDDLTDDEAFELVRGGGRAVLMARIAIAAEQFDTYEVKEAKSLADVYRMANRIVRTAEEKQAMADYHLRSLSVGDCIACDEGVFMADRIDFVKLSGIEPRLIYQIAEQRKAACPDCGEAKEPGYVASPGGPSSRCQHPFHNDWWARWAEAQKGLVA